MTEAEAKEAGYELKIGKFNYAANPKAAILGKKRGFVFITDKQYGEILGAHIIGPQATDLLAEPAYAMAMRPPLRTWLKQFMPIQPCTKPSTKRLRSQLTEPFTVRHEQPTR